MANGIQGGQFVGMIAEIMSEILSYFHAVQRIFGVKLRPDDEIANFNFWSKAS